MICPSTAWQKQEVDIREKFQQLVGVFFPQNYSGIDLHEVLGSSTMVKLVTLA
jgi:hypothetical protein